VHALADACFTDYCIQVSGVSVRPENVVKWRNFFNLLELSNQIGDVGCRTAGVAKSYGIGLTTADVPATIGSEGNAAKTYLLATVATQWRDHLDVGR